MDPFRYVLAAALDFVGPTDYNHGPSPESNMFGGVSRRSWTSSICPRALCPCSGMNAASAPPHGHRNIIEARRGTRTFPFTGPDRWHVASDDRQQLFEHVRKSGGITIPHNTNSE